MADESVLPPARHESTDVHPWVIWIGGPILVVVVVALTLLVLALFPGRTIDRTLQLPLPRFPAPELQVNPRLEMERFRADELRWLNSSGWIDKPHGIAHIPIQDAMREVAAEGIADWPTPPDTARGANSQAPGVQP